MEAALALQPERMALLLLFASLRTGAALALLPTMGGQVIPLRVRIGLAGCIGFLVMGNQPAIRPPADFLGLPGLAAIAGELLIGAVAGLALHAAFAVATIAGEFLSQGMGLGFATMVEPSMPPSPVLSGLMALLMWAMFLTAGGHVLLLRLLVESYATLPTAGPLFDPDRLARIVEWGSFAMATGVIAALPLAAALLLVNLSLAVAARSAPQLNLFSIGFPLMLLAGLVGLPLALPALADSFAGALAQMQNRAAEVLLG